MTDAPDPARYLDTDAIAVELGVHPQTIQAAFRDGTLAGRKVGHGWRTTRAAVDAWVEGRPPDAAWPWTEPPANALGIETKEHEPRLR